MNNALSNHKRTFFSIDENLVHKLILESPYLLECNLYEGKMGIILFMFEYSRLTRNVGFEKFANYLLEQLWEEVDIDSSINLSCGLSGIGVGIEYLFQNKFIECESTLELCEDLNKQIMSKSIYRMEDFSFESGLSGIIYYILIHLRNNNRMPFDALFLREIYEKSLNIDMNTLECNSRYYISCYIKYYNKVSLNSVYPRLEHFVKKNINIDCVSKNDANLGLHCGITGYMCSEYLINNL